MHDQPLESSPVGAAPPHTPSPPPGVAPTAQRAGSAADAGVSPFRELLRVAVPTVATMTSYTVMTFVDKWLVSKIGPDPIYVGAQGNGGLASWVPLSIAHGLLMVINTYVSQNMGAGRPERGPAYAWNGLWIGLAYWAVVLLPLGLAMPWVFGLIARHPGEARGMDPDQARMAGEYASVLLLGSCLTIATRSFGQFFYGMHRAGVVMTAGVIANVVNLGLSYSLIFGHFGLPALGVTGSAIGTVIATGVEAAIVGGVFLSPRLNAALRTRAAWMPSRTHAKDLLRLGWPGGVMMGNEMVCWGFFMVYLVSRFGKEHATAGWIAHQYMSLSFMPAVGISVACTAIVGKYMGMGRPDIAQQRAWMAVRIAMVYMGVCGVLFITLRGALVGVFVDRHTPPDTAAELVRLGSAFLTATAAFQLFDAVAMTLSGALRGAGDTVVPGVMTLAASWTVIVGGGLGLVTYAPGLSSLGPWIAAAAYIASLCVLLLARFLTGRWKAIRLVTPAGPADGGAGAA